MVNILIGCTGSVATIKLPLLLDTIKTEFKAKEIVYAIKVIVTNSSKHFFDEESLPSNIEVYDDKDEWSQWKKRGDPVLHIALGQWADVCLVAPLDANTLGKISNGICDNFLTCTARAWEISKPLILCPAMNTKMYIHPITKVQLELVQSWGYHVIPAIEKTLVCGDTGIGAMAEVNTIVEHLINTCTSKGLLKNK